MKQKTTILFTVLDGAAGRENPELNGKTALEAAKTPALDRIAKNGETGMMTVIPDTAPESDSAVLSLLGYDPEKYYTGRGPLEAIGAGMKYQDGELALRCNYATIKEEKENLIDRRVARSLTKRETEELEKIINQEIELENAEFRFKSTQQHRAALVIKDKDEKTLSPRITNTDPAYDRKGLISIAKEEYKPEIKECEAKEPEAKRSAELVNEFTEKAIKALENTKINEKREKEGKMKANAIITRDAGSKKPEVSTLEDQYGLKYSLLANMPLERGIAEISGMKTVKINEEEDYEEWLKKTLEATEENDFVYIHLKGPDLPGHDGKPVKKKEKIEEIDQEYYSELLEQINLNNTIIIVTSDHSTPCTMETHTSDPVPIAISHPALSGKAMKFNEKEAEKGTLKIPRATLLMPYLIRIYNGI